MGMIISPDSELGKELEKWNRPYVYRPYPKMVYRAQKVNGKVVCIMPVPSQWGWRDAAEYQNAILHAEAVTQQNQLTVQDEDGLKKAREQGWRETPQAAIDHVEAVEQDIARAAAEANFGAKRMGEGARREHAAATDSTHEHVVDVKPTRKRGRPAKAAPIPVTGSGEVATE